MSASANADGSQRAIVRADLLIDPKKLDATSFQLEFLPSGMLCTGRVTKVHSLGFEATCRAAGRHSPRRPRGLGGSSGELLHWSHRVHA